VALAWRWRGVEERHFGSAHASADPGHLPLREESGIAQDKSATAGAAPLSGASGLVEVGLTRWPS